jgi:hypothetical protein
MEKVATSMMPFVNDVKQGIHSSMVSTIVEPKAIFMHLGLLEFLTTISKFAACVFIWSSIKRPTIKEIVDYLFHGLSLPFEIIGHDNYKKIETSWGKYLKVTDGSKEIFLKNLSMTMFIGSTRIDKENTIVIDDNPKKCICNDSGNCLFLQTWIC